RARGGEGGIEAGRMKCDWRTAKISALWVHRMLVLTAELGELRPLRRSQSKRAHPRLNSMTWRKSWSPIQRRFRIACRRLIPLTQVALDVVANAELLFSEPPPSTISRQVSGLRLAASPRRVSNETCR